MNISKNELIEILKANTPRDWNESDVSNEMLAAFNKGFAEHLKVYPDYDPMATDDYRGKPDDDFLRLMIKVSKAVPKDANGKPDKEQLKKQDLDNRVIEGLIGESLVQNGWPIEYQKVQFNARQCEVALDSAYAGMSWDGIKSVVSKFPERYVQIALNKNHQWSAFKEDVKAYIPKLAAFCLGPNLDGNISCWKDYANGPFQILKMKLGDLPDAPKMVESIVEAFGKKCPMSPATKAAMRHEVIPNLHMKIYESSFEMDAGEFADIAAALNSTAQNLAEIVHTFVSKAIVKARELNAEKNNAGGADDNAATNRNQEIFTCYHECVDGGSSSDEALAKCAEMFNMSVDEIKNILTTMNVNFDAAASDVASISAAAPVAAASQDTATANPFALQVNKQYQTASGQVLTLRKMSVGQNPVLVFEDDNTGEKVEMLSDKFFNLNPKEANIDTTKSRKSLINKFKKRINLSAMKHTAKIIYKTKTGRKVYENLDSIKSGGKPVGDIAGVSIGTKGNGKNQIEYVSGNTIKAGDIMGTIKGFKVNENAEPEIVVKTPEGDEVTITVADFEEAGPEMTTPLTVGEHVEYKGYSLLLNAEDQTWSVTLDDVKQEGAEGLTEDEAKAWVDAKLEEEDGAGAEPTNEGISRRFIKESKGGSIQLKTFSEVLAETNNLGLRKNLVAAKPAK